MSTTFNIIRSGVIALTLSAFVVMDCSSQESQSEKSEQNFAALHTALINHYSPHASAIKNNDQVVIQQIQARAEKALINPSFQILLQALDKYLQASGQSSDSIEDVLSKMEIDCRSPTGQLAFQVRKAYLFLLYPEQQSARLAGINLPQKISSRKANHEKLMWPSNLC